MDYQITFNQFHGKSDQDQIEDNTKNCNQMIGELQAEILEDIINHVDLFAPLSEQIYALVEGCEFFNNQNDSFMLQLKQDLLSIANIDWEMHHGQEKQELMEIYNTGDKNIDQEFENELQQILTEMKTNCQNHTLQKLMNEVFQENWFCNSIYYANEKYYNKTLYNFLYFYSFCTDLKTKILCSSM